MISEIINLIQLNKSDIGNYKFNSEYEMFLDENKQNIFIIKFHISYNYLNDYSIISLYTIPIDNFIISKRDEYDLNKSSIIQLWKKKFQGIIKKYSVSQDKKYLAVLLDTIYKDKNKIISVIKYIEIFNISKTEKIYIEGNLRISNIDVAKDIIVISRKGKEYADILIKNKTSEIWEEYDIHDYKNNNTLIDEDDNDNNKIVYYNRINSFKILESNETDLSLLELYISINNKGIYANKVLIDFNKVNFTSNEKILLSIRLDKDLDDIIDDTVSYIYDIKSSISQLKDNYFHNSIFSQNNLRVNKLLTFEFFHRTIVSLNITSFELERIATLSSGIKSIQSDETTNNLIAIDDKGDMYYFYRRNSLEGYSDYKIITLDNIPPKFKNSQILASYIETFNKEKTRLILLMDNSVIISLDFKKIIKKMNRGLITVIFSDYFYTIFMAVFNLLIIIIVLQKRKKRKQRVNDITNVINNLANLRREQ